MLHHLNKLPCQLITLLISGSILTGCQSNTQTGALLGTGIGSGIGAIVGHQIGKGKEGALIGAGAGALTGSLLGKNEDLKQERDNAVSYAHHQDMAHQAAMNAVTNEQVIQMTRKGMPDKLIISTIHANGGRFDTRTQAVIALHEQGVSESVIQTMHQYH